MAEEAEVLTFDSLEDLITFLNTCGDEIQINIHIEPAERRENDGAEEDG